MKNITGSIGNIAKYTYSNEQQSLNFSQKNMRCDVRKPVFGVSDQV